MSAVVDLPDAELEVLACLQKQGKATAREIREGMRAYRPMAHASVLTLLTRLESKALVRREKGPFGKAFVYLPTARSRATGARVLQKLLRRVFHGNAVALVTSLFQSNPPNREELAQLKTLLASLRLSRRNKPRSD